MGESKGNPVAIAIMDRRPEALADIKAAVATNLATELGDRPSAALSARSSFPAGGPRERPILKT